MTDVAYHYDVVRGSALSDRDCSELSRVFSSFYGKWSAQSPFNPGQQIKMPASRYRDWYAKDEFKIARCHCDGVLVGQAIYMDIPTSRGPVAFVVQLVVDEAHRHRGIATSILHAAFGFSDYYAWGIVTSSPCTIATLESATFRHGKPARIVREAAFVKKELFPHIGFLAKLDLDASDSHSRVNTAFYTDRSVAQPNANEIAARYGALPEGCEWLAIVFRDQEPDCLSGYAQLIDHSSEIVADAYRRMSQDTQKWAAHSEKEVDVILKQMPSLPKDAPICDFGAGSGRHVAALKNRGFIDVTGIDFAICTGASENNVIKADCRTWKGAKKFRLITCLYDVIGSFREEEQNRKILSNIASNLTSDGFAVVSVANRDYAAANDIEDVDSEDVPNFLETLFHLSPSNAMSSDGEFFHHTGLCDLRKGLYFHKEQFKDAAAGLPAEYIVVDRRYTKEEIVESLSSVGLEITALRYVRAGFDRDYSRADGKEILLFCRPIPKGDTL